jgi:CheY-like chemotaxis protein
MPQYKDTPVIFITANADFQNRAQSILSGGNDLIPKPVSPLELVLKVTMRLLQPQGSPTDSGQRAAVQNGSSLAVARGSVTAPKEATPVAPIAMAAKPPEPTELKTPLAEPPAIAAKLDSSFSTEMVRKAWSAERINTPAEKPVDNGAHKEVLPETKVDLSKTETNAKTASEAPNVKLEPQAMSISPLKMAEDEKPRHVNGVEKSGELKETKIELPKPEQPVAELAKVEEPKIELPKAEEPKMEGPKVELPKIEAPKVETPKVEALKVEEPKAEQPKIEIPKVEVPKVELPKVEVPVSAPVPAQEVKAELAPKHQPESQSAAQPSKTETKTVEPAKAEKTSNSTNPKPQHTKSNMENTKAPTLDEAARGVARIMFGDENLNDMNVRLTRIALERYNVPGTQKLDDVARGVSQIIFGDDKVSEMNVRLTRIALERYNVADVLHLNGSNGTTKAAA